jgi:hypothetical protein
VRELSAAAAAPLRHGLAEPRLAAAVEAVRRAGPEGAAGIGVAGDGCFAVPREVCRSQLVARHVLGGLPLDPAVEAALLRPLLRGGFAERAPGGFGWAEIAACCPALRHPSEVVAHYVRALGVMGMLAHGADGLWHRPTRGAGRSKGPLLLGRVGRAGAAAGLNGHAFDLARLSGRGILKGESTWRPR